MHSQNLKHIPGITDVPEEQALAEFLFVNNVICKGEFLPPRPGMLSKFFVNMPPSYTSKILIGKDVNDNYFIGLDEETATFLLNLDFGIVVNEKFMALSVNAINSNFIIRLPVIPEICNDLSLLISGNKEQVTTVEQETTSDAADDDFFAELENEARLAQVDDSDDASGISADARIKVETYYRPFGYDFALKKSAKASRYVPISLADSLSIN